MALTKEQIINELKEIRDCVGDFSTYKIQDYINELIEDIKS